MADVGWGWLEQYEQFGRLGDHKHDFETITFVEAKTKYSSFMHASHGMIFAKDDRILWKLYKAKAAVLMQLRFDGVFGFPGGLVEPGEDPVDGLNREMEEEIGLDLKKHSFLDSDHIASFVNSEKSLVLHFFLKEVTLEDFCVLEMNNLRAPEYGTETYGVVRVPLFTMGDGVRGFPAFLANHFAGNAREELLMALKHCNILTVQEIQTALVSSEEFVTSVRS
ncbi:U8 snoRNA-decapping enzyme-like [Gigantopelta aegis]|uniref:U8 snoRNA-decapping enzyme-like n=1 Tax=Gigantopelta aegis TaxID=1735272 RepID=UPI001B88804F|nr:U8 snoRNA-decapping enzyme-like [Gigantopelta aegis]